MTANVVYIRNFFAIFLYKKARKAVMMNNAKRIAITIKADIQIVRLKKVSGLFLCKICQYQFCQFA